MLRMGFMPSDFHPLVLVLGGQDEIGRFAGLLRAWAAAPVDTLVERSEVLAPTGTSILLTTSGERPGLWPIDYAAARLRWTLDPVRAARFAAQVDSLATPGRRAGSEILECDTPGEVKLHVSFGEWEDDVLDTTGK
jgi:hypothetical protein